MRGPLALVGSGEYLPVMQPVEALLLEGRAPRYVQLPTAAAEEGERSLARWVGLGRKQAERLGVEAVPVVVRDREEADDPALAALVEGAGLVYLSGGNPPYLATTLRGTRVWDAIKAAWESGAALAGCSAGAMAMSDRVPHVRARDRAPEEGLGVLPGWRVLPHFDRMKHWDPGLVKRTIAELPAGEVVVGIDEETALVQQDGAWVVHGRQQVHLLTPDERTSYRAGASVPLPSPL
ncbi:MAG TPA: Type 1 glutamine amidotransferase-like domain-containing protein [Mycobacteriales bacterium]|nr:Type 1 glutamine amidotransferase-like domain-containing protein [Mycobacteriales bacterium]